VILSKDGDQVRRPVKKWFVFICTEWRKRLQPFLWRAALIELSLFLFRRDPYLMFNRKVTDYHEMPGLQVRSIRRGSSSQQTLLEDLLRHRPI